MAGGTFTVAVATDADVLARTLRSFAEDQIPFAAAVALTRMAQDVKLAEASDAPLRMRVHGQFIRRSFRVRRAEKRDWPRLTAEVGSVFEPLVLQEVGGTKTARGGGSVAIPARYVDARRSPTTGRPPRGLLPRNIKKSRKIPGVRIKGPVKLPGRRRMEITLWILKRAVRIRPRLKFRAVAAEVASAKYGGHFTRELEAAIRSARVRGGHFSSEAGRLSYLRARAGVS